MKDYYAILGVRQDDTADTIRQKYRSLAKKYHPDLHPGDEQAEERFKDIGEAWGVLGDKKKRQEYDAARLKGNDKKGTKKSTAPTGAVDFEDLMGRFDQFFGQGFEEQPKGSKSGKNPLDATELFEKYMGIQNKQ